MTYYLEAPGGVPKSRPQVNAAGDRCFECRKTHRDAKQNNRRYAELVALEKPTSEQLLKMAEICMLEVKAGRFNAKKLHTAKSLLRRVSRQYLDGDHPDKTAIERLEIELNRLLGKT